MQRIGSRLGIGSEPALKLPWWRRGNHTRVNASKENTSPPADRMLHQQIYSNWHKYTSTHLEKTQFWVEKQLCRLTLRILTKKCKKIFGGWKKNIFLTKFSFDCYGFKSHISAIFTSALSGTCCYKSCWTVQTGKIRWGEGRDKKRC